MQSEESFINLTSFKKPLSYLFMRQNLIYARYYLNLMARSSIELDYLLEYNSDCKIIKASETHFLYNASNIYEQTVVVELSLDENSAIDIKEVVNISKFTDDMRLFIQFKTTNESKYLLESISFLSKSGFDLFYFNEKKRQIIKLDKNTSLSHLSKDDNRNERVLYCLKREKSLSIIYFLHSSNPGGADRSAYEAVNNMIARYGVVTTIVMPEKGIMNQWYSDIGVPVININYGWWTVNPFFSAEDIGSSFSKVIKQIELFASLNADVVMTQTMVIPWGAITSILLKKPHLWNIREYGEKDHDLVFHYPFDQIIDFIKSYSDFITTCGKNVKDYLFHELSSDRVGLAYARIDFNNPSPKKIVKTNDNFLTLIIPASIAPSKGQFEAVEAIAELVNVQNKKNFHLLIIGEANVDYLKRIEAVVEKEALNDYVEIKDYSSDIYEQINSADVVLSCSKMEAFGRVIVEGLILGKPVIASNTGGNTEIITNGINGLLYEQGNYKDLAKKIACFLDHPEYLGIMGNEGPESVKKLLNGKYADETLYNQSINLKYTLKAINGELLIDHLKRLIRLERKYIQTIYIDTGDGYNANQYKRHVVVLKIDNHFKVSFALKEYQYIKSIRFDPAEGFLCRVRLHQVIFKDKYGALKELDVTELTTNGFYNEDGFTTFNHSEPMFFIPLTGELQSIEIYGELELLSSKQIEEKIIKVLVKSLEEYRGIKKLGKELIRQLIVQKAPWLISPVSKTRKILKF